MRKRSLFQGGPEVGEIGLSLSSLPSARQPVRRLAMIAPENEDPGVSGEDAMAETIRAAVAHGANLIDTDWITANGHAQEVLGRSLAGVDRDSVIITSKAGPRLAFHGELLIDNSRANLMNQCHDSLFRLKTERIDLYQVHWPDDTSPTQTARGLADIVSGGYARWSGVCNYGLPQLEALTGQIKLQTVQAPLSLLNRSALDDLLPWCMKRGIGFLAADPLASGLLSGRFTGDEEFTDEDRDGIFSPETFKRAATFASELATLGDPVRLCVGWVLAQEGVSCVLCPLMDLTTLANAEPLSPEMLARLDALAATHGFGRGLSAED